MNTVHLDTGHDAYDIHVGSGLITSRALFEGAISGRQVFVVSNPAVAERYLETLCATLEGYQVDCFLMPDGEQHKTLDTLGDVIAALISKGHTRQTTLVALGGGVVGDTAGFAAASYQRGVPFVQVPTTLLAQVDSSVGGKTAVNHPLAKNMIGAFHQPRAVIIDTDTLQTLPDRELSAGLAEVIKHGVLADWEYFEWLERNCQALLALEPQAIGEAITRSCEIKAAVVSRDEKESGVRALLNLGHTFGHAIEASQGYGAWLHGEAVAAGMVMAADLSLRMGKVSQRDAWRVRSLLSACGLPVTPPTDMSADDFLQLMARDKKTTADGLRLVLLNAPGDAYLDDRVPEALLRETLTRGSALCEPL